MRDRLQTALDLVSKTRLVIDSPNPAYPLEYLCDAIDQVIRQLDEDCQTTGDDVTPNPVSRPRAGAVANYVVTLHWDVNSSPPIGPFTHAKAKAFAQDAKRTLREAGRPIRTSIVVLADPSRGQAWVNSRKIEERVADDGDE